MATVHPEQNIKKPILASQEEEDALGLETFDWQRGVFRKTQTRLIILNLIFQLALCVILLFIPWLIYRNEWVHIDYPLIADGPPAAMSTNVEAIRWLFILGFGVLGYFLANLAILATVYGLYFGYNWQKVEVSRRITRLVDHVFYLRGGICCFFATMAMFIVANLYFPLSADELRSTVDPDKGKQGTLEATATMMTGFAFAQTFRQYNMTHSTNFFVKSVFASLFAIFSVMLAEKVLVQKISSVFFHRSCAQRLADNKFAVKTTRKLRDAILLSHPEMQGSDTATIIYQGTSDDNTAIMVSNLQKLLSKTDADIYFNMLDKDHMKELNQIQVSRAIAFFYEEQEWLRLAMMDQQKIIRKLDRLLMMIAYLLCLVIILAAFQVSLQTMLAALGGLAGFLFFMSEGTLKSSFESIIFVIFTHPFDVGDMVVIKGENHCVKELGLWTSTFEGPGNRVTYISNARLKSEPVINMRRSPPQEELIRINILPSTSNDRIKALEQGLLHFVRTNHRDYLPKLSLTNINILDKDTMRIDILLAHRSNFQDWPLKNMRTRAFLLQLREAIHDCGIEVSPPKWHEIS